MLEAFLSDYLNQVRRRASRGDILSAYMHHPAGNLFLEVEAADVTFWDGLVAGWEKEMVRERRSRLVYVGEVQVS